MKVNLNMLFLNLITLILINNYKYVIHCALYVMVYLQWRSKKHEATVESLWLGRSFFIKAATDRDSTWVLILLHSFFCSTVRFYSKLCLYNDKVALSIAANSTTCETVVYLLFYRHTLSLSVIFHYCSWIHSSWATRHLRIVNFFFLFT